MEEEEEEGERGILVTIRISTVPVAISKAHDLTNVLCTNICKYNQNEKEF